MAKSFMETQRTSHQSWHPASCYIRARSIDMSLPRPLINRDRTQSVLETFGVDAMVLTDPTSIYQATGYWPQTVAMGQMGAAMAVVPADRKRPVALITSQFLHYLYDLDDAPSGSPLQFFLYTAPFGMEGAASAPLFLPEMPDGRPDPWDRITRDATLSQLEMRPAFPSALAALQGALEDAGAKGLIGTDSLLVEAYLGDIFTYRPADPLLRRIRMIKSPDEIALMRYAARTNAEVARACILAMKPGDRYEDLRRSFFAETGKRGGSALFISTDSPSIRQRDGIIREGRSFQIDAVSSYGGYHGDYGRTVFVGEADPVIRRTLDASIVANQAITKILKPGLRYSEVAKIGKDAIRDAGYDVIVPCTAHSVGLFHTDEAYKDDALHFVKDDHLIEKDMTLSIDCPALIADGAGNVHLEDLWLITEDGCEPLNDTSDPFLQI
jgi:Xaa-Pro aminopeptidase